MEFCSHPALLHDEHGVLRCMACGAEIKPEKPTKKKAEPKAEAVEEAVNPDE